MKDVQLNSLVAIVCIIPLLVLDTGITIHALYQLLRNDVSRWMNKTYRNLTIIVIIPFTVCIYLNAAMVITIYLSDFHLTGYVLLVTKNVFYQFGKAAFYILLLLQITIPFSLNKCIIYSLSIIIFTSIVSAIVYIIGISLLYLVYFNLYQDLKFYLIGMLLGIDFVLNVGILIIFITKIKGIVHNIDPSSSLIAQRNVNLMSNTVAKYGLLYGITIFTNQLYALSFLYNELYLNGGFDNHFVDVAQVIEVSVNIVVLWLILRRNYDKYICLCKCCHFFMARCCFKNIDMRQMADNPYFESTLQLSQVTSNPASTNFTAVMGK